MPAWCNIWAGWMFHCVPGIIAIPSVILSRVVLQAQSNGALRDLSRTLDAATAEAEVTLAPIARRHAEQAQKQLQELEKQWTNAAADYDRSSRGQQQQQFGRSRGQQHRLSAGSSSDGGWDG